MRLTVLGGGGGYPVPGQPCSGYLVEHDGFRLLLDPGHGTVTELMRRLPAEAVDAVAITHAHADHCVDLNALLRVRHLGEQPPAALPVLAPAGALEAVLALDGSMLAADHELRELTAGEVVGIGPFSLTPVELPHYVTDLGLRLDTGDAVLAYTGDSGPSPRTADLARDADLFLAEASFVDEVPEESAAHLSSARDRGVTAAEAGVRRLLLCHVWPGDDPGRLASAAGQAFSGEVIVAAPGLTLDPLAP